MLIRLHLNRVATLRDIAFLCRSEALSLESGYAVVKRYVAYQCRRPSLLKEGELISAALIVGEERGIRMQQVVNTRMLVSKLRGGPARSVTGGLTPVQQKMHQYTLKYHGRAVGVEDAGVARGGSKAQTMKAYCRTYRVMHDHIGCVTT